MTPVAAVKFSSLEDLYLNIVLNAVNISTRSALMPLTTPAPEHRHTQAQEYFSPLSHLLYLGH